MSKASKQIGLSFHYVSYDYKFLSLEIDSNGEIIEKSLFHWQSFVYQITEIVKKQKQIQVKGNALNINAPDPWIYVLFIDQSLMSHRELFDNIFEWEIRPTVASEKRQDSFKWSYKPVISISHEDFVEIGTQVNDYADKQLLHNLAIDPRAKFLDSGIWHRYVPEIPDGGESFADCFRNTVKEIIENWSKELYELLPAVTTLEFQIRMLKHSYIGDFSSDKGGHARLVTPFKFHSERHLKHRTEKEAVFLLEKKWNGKTLIEHLNWRFLIVDDYAGQGIRKTDDSAANINKLELIMQPIDRLLGGIKRREALDLFKIVSFNDGKNILDRSIQQLKNQVADIVFLDYLLGEGQNPGQREFGHEFLLRLIENDRITSTDNLQRDYLGKYWIFPVSSFPYALQDKLTQLGVGHLQSIWHISSGGDPICTPHLYSFYLLRFLKQRIGEFFVYPKALKHFLNSVPVNTYDSRDAANWAKVLNFSIDKWNVHFNLYHREINYDNNSSLFTRSITDFVDENTEIRKLFEKIHKILEIIEGDGENLRKDLVETILELGEYTAYHKAITVFLEKIHFFINEDYQKSIEKIKKLKGATQIILSKFGLELLPNDELRKETQLRKIDISRNNLKELPWVLSHLPNLREVNLSNNKISIISINEINKFDDDMVIDFTGNPLVKPTLSKKVKVSEIKSYLNKDTSLEVQENPSIFVSYSNKSLDYKKKFDELIMPILKRKFNIDIWSDIQIELGSKWDKTIDANLEKANVFIFLVDNNFMASAFIQEKEIPIAIKRHEQDGVLLLPIVIEECGFNTSTLRAFSRIPKVKDKETISQYKRANVGWGIAQRDIESILREKFPQSVKEIPN